MLKKKKGQRFYIEPPKKPLKGYKDYKRKFLYQIVGATAGWLIGGIVVFPLTSHFTNPQVVTIVNIVGIVIGAWAGNLVFKKRSKD
jgi:hypothetical protein